MSRERLNAAIEASALIRQVEAAGDFAVLLRRGDPDRGSLLLIIASRGEHVGCLERRLDLRSGNYVWNRAGPERGSSSTEIRAFLEYQARFDPDLWQIELDIARAERFIAETIASG